MTTSLFAVAAAATFAVARTHGRDWVRRTLDRRAHPARTTRIVVITAGALGTAGLAATIAEATPRQPTPAIGWEVDVTDPTTLDATPTLVLYDRIPAEPRPEPDASSYASPFAGPYG